MSRTRAEREKISTIGIVGLLALLSRRFKHTAVSCNGDVATPGEGCASARGLSSGSVVRLCHENTEFSCEVGMEIEQTEAERRFEALNANAVVGARNQQLSVLLLNGIFKSLIGH